MGDCHRRPLKKCEIISSCHIWISADRETWQYSVSRIICQAKIWSCNIHHWIVTPQLAVWCALSAEQNWEIFWLCASFSLMKQLWDWHKIRHQIISHRIRRMWTHQCRLWKLWSAFIRKVCQPLAFARKDSSLRNAQLIIRPDNQWFVRTSKAPKLCGTNRHWKWCTVADWQSDVKCFCSNAIKMDKQW